jgi:plasmid stabilization system protein ParE
VNVRMLPAAEADAQEAGDRLDGFRAGWGAAFAAEVGQAVAAIGANPQLYPRTEDGPDFPENREYFIARFEYRVIYAIWKGEAVIVAVIHARRRVGAWRDRLTELD